MGVPRAFYAAFAGHLAEQGIAALTVDYRGIGDPAAARAP
jgi:predicted alpha/beta hydrolase